MTSDKGLPRRAVLGGMATLGAASMLAAPAVAAPAVPAPAAGAGKVPIAFGCGLYDRMLPLYTGEIQPEGIDLKFTPSFEARKLFDEVERGAYDVSEMSSSEFIAHKSAGKLPFVAIPVFPSRNFRHGYIIVNAKSGIKKPKDLEGKRVGITLYTISAAIWIRGMLQHEYGVDLSKLHWVQGAVDTAGGWGNPEVLPLLKPVPIETNKTGKSLDELIKTGEVDAVITANLPADFGEDPRVVRLFPNFREVEQEYYKRTRVFPIMHVIIIRNAVYEKHPWVASSLYKAFTKSKDLALFRMRDGIGSLPYMLPWMNAESVELNKLFGKDHWPYGIEPNRATLETLIGYMVDQSMIKERIKVDDLFVPV